MRVSGAWFFAMLLCIVNIALGHNTLSDTARTVLYVAALGFCCVWAEGIAYNRRAAEREERGKEKGEDHGE